MSVHDANYKKIKKELGIPEDEPIFIIRAQDDLAAAIVSRYRNMAAQIEDDAVRPDEAWMTRMDGLVSEFTQFRNEHPDRVKVPD